MGLELDVSTDFGLFFNDFTLVIKCTPTLVIMLNSDLGWICNTESFAIGSIHSFLSLSLLLLLVFVRSPKKLTSSSMDVILPSGVILNLLALLALIGDLDGDLEGDPLPTPVPVSTNNSEAVVCIKLSTAGSLGEL